MLDLNHLLIFSENPKKLGEFYKKILNKDYDWTGGDFFGFSAGSSWIGFGPHNKVKGKNNQPERIIINFQTNDVENEFIRIKNLGAKVIAKPYHPKESPDMILATLEDPDGNYFQLASPMK
jgi:predicted enzyme related to lactoylglutathione lyase